MAFTLMHSPGHFEPGGGGGEGEGLGGDGDGLNTATVLQHWMLDAPGHMPRRNASPLQSYLLTSAHSPWQRPGGGGEGLGGGGGDDLKTVRVGQHFMLDAPGHRFVWNAAPWQSNLPVSAHSPAHLPGGGGEGDGLGGGGGEAAARPLGQHR